MAGVEPHKLSDESILQKVKELKDEGNKAHREGNYKRAARQYYNAIMYIKALSVNQAGMNNFASLLGIGDTATQPSSSTLAQRQPLDTDSKNLICDCYNNLSACMLKEEHPKYERIVEYCDKALEMSPTNVKALFRKGLALYSIGKHEEALAMFQQAPTNDAQVRKYTDLCKAEIARQDRELSSKFRNMFKS